MRFYLQNRRKRLVFILLFFSCFSLKSLSENKNLNLLKVSNSPVIDQDYYQTQADALYLRAEMAYFNHQPVLAIDYLKEACLLAPNSLHLRSRLAGIYEQENLLAEAIKQYEDLAQKTKHRDFYLKLGNLYSLRDLNQEALKAYKNVDDKKSFTINFQKARFYLAERDWEGALKALEKSLENAKTSLEKGEALLVKAYIDNNRFKSLRQNRIFQQILNLNLREEDFILKASQFYISSHQYKKAKQLLLAYQQKEESSIKISKALFDVFLFLNQKEGAYKQFRYLQNLSALEDTHYFFITAFLLSKNQYDKTIPFLQDLIKKHPSNHYYNYLLGIVYGENKNWNKSLQQYQKVTKGSPYFLAAQLQQGQVWKEKGDTKKALHLLKKTTLSSQQSKDPKPFLVYAQYLWEEGMQARAFMALEKGINLHTKNTDLLFLRGVYLREVNQEEKALKDMEKILEINASHSEAMNFMAYVYANQKKNLDHAEALSYQAMSLQPSSSYFLDTLGWVLFQKENYPKALFYLKKAFSHNKKDVSIMKHLGQTYYKLKNYKKCEYFFKQALKLETNEKKRSQIKKQLASLP
ncbi:MAG: hypothetical protein ACR2M7_03480 [Bdellovibrionales bacterium]